MSDPDAPVRSLPAGILEYELPDGWLVFAGKTDAANDYVSLKLARQNDRWFHVRGMPGGHVVLRVSTERTPDRVTLERAAGIAAYHSKARTGGVVEVCLAPSETARDPNWESPWLV